jgi:hypothetical protein
LQQHTGTCQALGQEPDRLDIGIAVPAVASVSSGRVQRQPIIEQPFAGEIVVQPQDIWRARMINKKGELIG